MIPVELELLKIADDKTREAAYMLLPEYVFNEPGVILLGARAAGGVLAGGLACAPVIGKDDEPDDGADKDRQILRIHWIEVLPEYRRGGIGILMMDALTSYLAESNDVPLLTIWYDDDDVAAGFEDFLDSTGLFLISGQKSGKRNVHIALWTGNTYKNAESEDAD